MLDGTWLSRSATCCAVGAWLVELHVSQSLCVPRAWHIISKEDELDTHIENRT